MARFLIVLCLLFTIDNLVSGQESCDASTFTTKCGNFTYTDSNFCSATETYIKCAEDTIINNEDCPDTVKQFTKQSLDITKSEFDSYGCSVGSSQASPQGGCDPATFATVCPMPIATASDYCSVTETYIKCVEDNIVNNAACPDAVKQDWKQSMDLVRDNLGSECSVRSTQASPQEGCDEETVLARCPKPSPTIQDFCSVVETWFKCIENNIFNNAACSDGVKQGSKEDMAMIQSQMDKIGCSAADSGSVIAASILSLALCGTAQYLMIFK